ncbi:MAG: hypothetical protein RMK30_08305 [Anaerolineae bacterium]|nr:hypothetical protein [Anaerolineae bacterium]MDW8102863.1 hypothetical protein [Anaerolineae bacterium]
MKKWIAVLVAVVVIGLLLGAGVKVASAQAPTPTPTPKAPAPVPFKGFWRGWECNLRTVAEILGMSPDELATALRNGKTIAQLAQEKGIALSTIVDRCLQFEKDWLSFLVQKGYITQEMADKWLSIKRQMLEFQFTYNWKRGVGWGWGRMRGPKGFGPCW